jgi:hypothetical protein
VPSVQLARSVHGALVLVTAGERFESAHLLPVLGYAMALSTCEWTQEERNVMAGLGFPDAKIPGDGVTQQIPMSDFRVLAAWALTK